MISTNNSSTPETIIALSTPSGAGALAVVKLSGSRALEIALKLSRRDHLQPRHATLANLWNREDEMMDEAILIYFKAPHSYTAEEVVEIQCHGGTLIARKIIQEALALGARVARAGEFTYRAFLNGRIDLSQAEAIGKLIEAKSDEAHKVLLKQLKGELGRYVEGVRGSLVEILAYAEVSIDYAEEDLPSDLEARMVEKIERIAEDLERIYQGSKRRSSLVEGYKLAIIGRPNVGKSSLLNALLLWERAIVSDIPGTTRDTIEESLHLGNHWVRIVDTAGIREAQDAIEKIGIERTLLALKESDMVLALFDSSQSLSPEDEQIKELLRAHQENRRILVLFNKSDLSRELQDGELESYPHRYISAKKGGVEELLSLLTSWLDEQGGGEELMLTSERQLLCVKSALGELKEARDRLIEGELELFAYHIQGALKELSLITRPYETSELLDVMFGQFCLGK
ncbi:MAG: tRNA uridine-5-carboxymethylaminomethyl(34) synthesis GTPase MnmE [Wolinella succinogenes]|uniref:tRNA uridine-5-carboxymethylaminomethyl(34) synthesis GTPase MnmE n=1 Tax=Wolinella succinogenes TaxID=844 RepID=UPI00169AED4C|nr:tRNA uridine-5-carboxymethylaminomethyl(34) synthesis GTPase MnmE [Wolinella succinogenes]NLU34474.1 tRNA uridine-5-carboxymethylaminomethyl(34) synthesis GTPase MnmE [Wolinella succinogenes]